MTDRKKLNKHDYNLINLETYNKLPHDRISSYSINIFKWIPKESGKGLKKSKSILRLRFTDNDEKKVVNVVDNYCNHLDEGWIPRFKSMTIK